MVCVQDAYILLRFGCGSNYNRDVLKNGRHSRARFTTIMTVRGEVGARRIICWNLQQALIVEIEDNCCFLDIEGKKDILKISSSTGIRHKASNS
jgi:hypothetical protein